MKMSTKPIDIFINILGKKTNEPEVQFLLNKYHLVEDNTFESPIYYENPNEGLSFLCENGKVDQIFLFSNGKDDFSQYKGALPGGLKFESGKEDVNRSFGEAMFSGRYQLYEEEKGFWDKYEFQNFAIHFTYNGLSTKIDLITLIHNEN